MGYCKLNNNSPICIAGRSWAQRAPPGDHTHSTDGGVAIGQTDGFDMRRFADRGSKPEQGDVVSWHSITAETLKCVRRALAEVAETS